MDLNNVLTGSCIEEPRKWDLFEDKTGDVILRCQRAGKSQCVLRILRNGSIKQIVCDPQTLVGALGMEIEGGEYVHVCREPQE